MRKQLYFREEIFKHPERVWPEMGDIREFQMWFTKRYNGGPIHLELGMGRGDFLVAMATVHPDEFFIGVEIKEERVYYANKKAQELNLNNILFLQIPAQTLPEYELPRVHHLYLMFSDPWPKLKHAKRRLTAESFLRLYRELLADNGELTMKTDDDALYEFSLETLQENKWQVLEKNTKYLSKEDFQSQYEKKWLSMGKNVGYLRAKPLR